MPNFGFSIFDEFLPTFDMFNSIERQRLMFLKLYNIKVPCKEQFSQQEILSSRNEPIFSTFREKIYSLLPKKFYKSSSFKVDIYKSELINKFVKISNKNISYIKLNEKEDISLAIKIIKRFDGEDLKLFLNGEDIFNKFVSKKIKDLNFDREVKVLKDEITIYPKDNIATKIYPYWKFFNKDNLEDIQPDIKRAIKCIENSECKQVYLVYPRHENFDKHIEIKVSKLDKFENYKIKLIPYSLRSILR